MHAKLMHFFKKPELGENFIFMDGWDGRNKGLLL